MELGAHFKIGCSGTFPAEPLAGCDAIHNRQALDRCEEIEFNDGCADSFWTNLCAWTCAGCALHSPTVSPTPAPTASPTLRSELEDQCAVETCAMFCSGSCGWDNTTGICRTGEVTSPKEHRLRLGDCPTPAPTPAATRTTTTSTGTTATSTTTATTQTEEISSCSAIRVDVAGGRQRCDLATLTLECTYDLGLATCRDKICGDLDYFQCVDANATVRGETCL